MGTKQSGDKRFLQRMQDELEEAKSRSGNCEQ
jgi:hypothetical protein